MISLSLQHRGKKKIRGDGYCIRNNSPSHLVAGGEILAAGEARAGPGGGIPPGREHGDAAVLQLDPAEVIEAVLIAVGDVSKGVPAPELGGGGADLGVERTVEGGGADGPVGEGGEGGGAGEEGG